MRVCTLPALSVTVIVTNVPSGKSVVPVIAGVVSFVLSGASTVSAGASLLTLPGSVAVPVLPAASVPDAVAVYGPSANGVPTPTLYVPPACTVAVKVCTAPALSVTTTVMTLPAGRSVVPLTVGVVSDVLSGASTVTTGGVRSTLPGSLAVVVLPALSCALAVAVYGPSASGVTTSTLYVPPACTVAVKVCTAPALSVTTTVTSLPTGRSVVPVTVGVVSDVLSGASTVRLGARLLTLPGSVAVATLPAGSCPLAVTVYGPSANGLATSTL